MPDPSSATPCQANHQYPVSNIQAVIGYWVSGIGDSGQSPSFLVVGLGNPGPRYAANRHNAGFQCVELLARAHDLSFGRLQHRARVATGTIAERRVVLAKPLTYMNLSGRAVGPLVRWYKVPLGQLMVIYDDLDLPLGAIRLRPAGGAGGHKGVGSIVAALGSEEFPRLRVGIGRPPAGWDPADYVLSDFTADELPLFHNAAETAAQAIECWLTDGLVPAMNRFNTGRTS